MWRERAGRRHKRYRFVKVKKCGTHGHFWGDNMAIWKAASGEAVFLIVWQGKLEKRKRIQ